MAWSKIIDFLFSGHPSFNILNQRILSDIMMKIPYQPGSQITLEAHKEKLERYRKLNTPIKTEKLIAIGYWHSVWEPDFPDPARFQDSEWKDKEIAIEHIQKGKSIASWMGYSWCRFRCNHTNMGCSDLTDGYYIFPEGLLHYIEFHQIRLPDEFVAHINSFLPKATDVEYEHCQIDYDWWKNQKGWKDKRSFLAPTDEAMERHIRRINQGKYNDNE